MYHRRMDDGTGAEKYPNPGVNVGEESYFPGHPLYRPELQLVHPPPHVVLPAPQKKKQRMTKPLLLEMMNSKTEEIIAELSSRGKFLPCDAVRKVVLDLCQNAKHQHGCHISWKEVSAYSNFSKCHGRIEELIKVYCLFTPFTTLHEMGVALSQSEGVSSYEELGLGPLIKHPKVKDYFKPPDDLDSPPEITVHRLHEHLFKLIDKSQRNAKFTIEDYLEFVRRKQDVESVEHLCIRITSFPLLIRVRNVAVVGECSSGCSSGGGM